MKTIKDLEEIASLNDSDEFLVSTVDGADRRVKFAVFNAGKSFTDINKSHNNIFRGKDLGIITSSNIDAFITEHGITTGEFTDLYVGDYFTISYAGTNKVIRIAGFDIFYQTGDTALTKHHIVCVPDNSFGTSYMNSSNTTSGGFIGSYMWSTTLPQINTNLEAVFGSHLLTYREYLTNSIDTNATCKGNPSWTGASNGRTWVNCKAVLMSEAEVYGTTIWQSSAYDTGIAYRQLPLFVIEPSYISRFREWYWLRDVASSTHFCYCSIIGVSSYDSASDTICVRPRFLLG